MPSDPDDPELATVAADVAANETMVMARDGELATSAREALDAAASRAAQAEPTQIGRFRIVRRIGAGGMGVVYSAHDDELDRDVAIKLLRSNLAVDLSGRERLMREAQAIARLSHPNIVHVYEVGDDGERVYMAMELIRGCTLRVFCKGKPWRAIVEVFLGAGEGLACAHRESIIHRDFKPDNVIVDDSARARVVDFGLARAPAGAPDPESFPTQDLGPGVPTPTTGRRPLSVDLTGAGTVLGTPAYMAPEQLARADPDARTDQFAFCVSLFEMLYDRRPFKGSTYTEIARAVLTGLEVDLDNGPRRIPRAVRAVVLRGLARAPEARFATMDELLTALRKTIAPARLRVLGYTAMAAAAGAMMVKLAGPATTPELAAPPAEIAVDPWADIVAATALPELIATPSPDDPTGVTVHRLRNGLTIYVAQRPMEPKVSITLAIRAGSEHERERGPGLAFMVLNSVYRGTARLGVRDANLERPSLVLQNALVGSLPSVDDPAAREAILLAAHAAEQSAAPYVLPTDVWDATAALGGSVRASRTGSGTTFKLELAAHRVDGGLSLLAEAIQYPAFRNMLSLVREQLDLYVSLTSNDLAWQTAQQEIAAATGLREDFAGAGAFVRQIPLAQAQAFHAAYYRPNNTAVVVVGDITPEAAVALCERHLGQWEPQPIPVRAPLDVALPGGVVRREIEDGGAPAVFISWALPPTDAPEYPAFVALADALNRQDGLGSGLRTTTATVQWQLTAYRTLDVRVTTLPGQTLADAEAQIDRALAAIADDLVPTQAWQPALARAELARLGWARDPENLAATVAASFIDGRAWTAVVKDLAGTPTRAELVGAARALRVRSRAVVHRRPGKTWHLPVIDLPGQRLPEQHGEHSPFAKTIIDAPTVPPEPRFLVAGSHYTSRPRPSADADAQPDHRARVIATEQAGPLALASWVYPIGVDDDALACDAIRARVWAVRIAGMDLDAFCANDFIWVDIAAPAARFERDAALVFDWLNHGMPSDSELEGYIERTLRGRAARRDSGAWRDPAFHTWALRGKHGIGVQMPSDSELRRGGARALTSALRRVDTRAADVLYVGPSVEAIAALVPSSVGAPAAGRTAPKTREVASDTIFLLDDPGRDDVEVRVTMAWPDLDPRAELAAELHFEAVYDGSTAGPPSLAPRWASTPWWATSHPLAWSVAYFAGTPDTELAVRTGIDALRGEIPVAEFENRRGLLEIGFRAHRTQIAKIPEAVRLWESSTDPRVTRWLALPSLEFQDMRRLYDLLSKRPIIVSIIADADDLDIAALAKYGTLVRVEPAEFASILRDAEGSG